MNLFFKFFLMGMTNFFKTILYIISFLIPISLGILAIILLDKILLLIYAIIIGVIITIIGYSILSILHHSIRAVKYCKEYNTDSLNRAWEKTKIEWD